MIFCSAHARAGIGCEILCGYCWYYNQAVLSKLIPREPSENFDGRVVNSRFGQTLRVEGSNCIGLELY